jgi:hypothetical protein
MERYGALVATVSSVMHDCVTHDLQNQIACLIEWQMRDCMRRVTPPMVLSQLTVCNRAHKSRENPDKIRRVCNVESCDKFCLNMLGLGSRKLIQIDAGPPPPSLWEVTCAHNPSFSPATKSSL